MAGGNYSWRRLSGKTCANSLSQQCLYSLALQCGDCNIHGSRDRRYVGRGMGKKWVLGAAALVLSGSVISFEAASAAQAPSLETLEKKIDALVDVINQQQKTIDMLLQQREPAPGAAPDAASASLDGQGLVSGLYMSVCPLKLDASRRLPDACQGLPPATVSVVPQARLGFEDALADEALAPFLKVQDGGVVGVRWSGRLAIARPGAHDFQLALGYGGKEYAGRVTCRSVLRLAGQGVVKVVAEFGSGQSNPVAVDQGNHSLEPGHYDLEVFLSCFTAFDRLRTVVGNPGMTRFLEGVSLTLTFAEPGDTALKPVPASRIGIAL